MQTKLTTEDTENTELKSQGNQELRNLGNGISVIEARP